MNSLCFHFSFSSICPLTLTLTQVQQWEVAAAVVTAVGSSERLPVDRSSLIQLVLMIVFACLCLFGPGRVCEGEPGATVNWCRETRRSSLPEIFISAGLGTTSPQTFTLILSRKGQRGNVAAACAVNDVFRSSDSSLCCVEGCFSYLSGQRKCY